MEYDKEHFRHLLLYCFDSIAEAHQFISETYSAPSVKTCEYWFRRFKSDNLVYMQWERYEKKANGFHMNCPN